LRELISITVSLLLLFFFFSGKSHYQCFGTWQRLSIASRDENEQKSTDDISHQIVVATAALTETRNKIIDRKQHLVMMDKQEKDLVASCMWTESELSARCVQVVWFFGAFFIFSLFFLSFFFFFFCSFLCFWRISHLSLSLSFCCLIFFFFI
jgi:hypothetical protein